MEGTKLTSASPKSSADAITWLKFSRNAFALFQILRKIEKIGRDESEGLTDDPVRLTRKNKTNLLVYHVQKTRENDRYPPKILRIGGFQKFWFNVIEPMKLILQT